MISMTATKKITLDTNILVYMFDIGDKKRQKKALKIFEKSVGANCVLTLQALSEFYHVTTRKSYLPIDVAQEQINDWQELFPIAVASSGTLNRAINAVKKYQLSFWDAMLWATAKDAGVDVIYTEDFNHNQEIGSVKFSNPLR